MSTRNNLKSRFHGGPCIPIRSDVGHHEKYAPRSEPLSYENNKHLSEWVLGHGLPRSIQVIAAQEASLVLQPKPFQSFSNQFAAVVVFDDRAHCFLCTMFVGADEPSWAAFCPSHNVRCGGACYPPR